jgi:hypothetical protein
MATRKNKFGNKKTLYDGIKFDSKYEQKRYIDLKILENAGVITNLERQFKIQLQPAFKHKGKTIQAIHYIADFIYEENGVIIIEDAKGFETEVFKIKAKMLKYQIATREDFIKYIGRNLENVEFKIFNTATKQFFQD